MGKKNLCFANLSIFCDVAGWQSLLKDSIVPQLDLFMGRSTITNYFFHFHYYQGAHLRVSFACLCQYKKEICVELDEIVKNYFSLHRSENSEIQKSPTSFFMNFPVDTWYFNIFSPYSLNDKYSNLSDIIEEIRYVISRTMLMAFAEEPADKDNSFTFSLYLQISLLKAYFPRIQKAIIAQKLLSSNILGKLNVQSQIACEQISLNFFFENKNLLTEMFTEIWEGDSQVDWLKDWYLNCERITKVVSYQQAFEELSELIFEQVAYRETFRLPISCNLMYYCQLKQFKSINN